VFIAWGLISNPPASIAYLICMHRRIGLMFAYSSVSHATFVFAYLSLASAAPLDTGIAYQVLRWRGEREKVSLWLCFHPRLLAASK